MKQWLSVIVLAIFISFIVFSSGCIKMEEKKETKGESIDEESILEDELTNLLENQSTQIDELEEELISEI